MCVGRQQTLGPTLIMTGSPNHLNCRGCDWISMCQQRTYCKKYKILNIYVCHIETIMQKMQVGKVSAYMANPTTPLVKIAITVTIDLLNSQKKPWPLCLTLLNILKMSGRT
jgi:hypothetical protein